MERNINKVSNIFAPASDDSLDDSWSTPSTEKGHEMWSKASQIQCKIKCNIKIYAVMMYKIKNMSHEFSQIVLTDPIFHVVNWSDEHDL